MSWRYIDPLLEKAARHSTIFGKYWATIIVIFRLTMLQFADRAWSDEQKEFRCNTKEPGCENVCFNQFAPISNVRLWGLQLLGCSIPACLYLVYVLHLVSRSQADEREKKRIVNQIKQTMNIDQKQQNNNHTNSNEPNNPTTQDDQNSIMYAKRGLSTEGLNFRKIQKYQKRQRKYSTFNKMILPAEYRNEAQARSSTERKIWRFYIFQILFRTCIDFGFMSLQYNVYPYRFVVPEIYVCEQKPCPWKVDCFVSRPTEKTIFFNYKYIIAIITCLINFLELWFIGWCRIRRAFKEDGPPPYVDIFNVPPAKASLKSDEKSATSSDSTLPISDHLSDHLVLPPIAGGVIPGRPDPSGKLETIVTDRPPQVPLTVGSRRSSKERFQRLSSIQSEAPSSSTDNDNRTKSPIKPERRNKKSSNHSNGHPYHMQSEMKSPLREKSPFESTAEPYLQ